MKARAPAASARQRGFEFTHALESVSRGIADPAAKLKFIRGSLEKFHGADRAVSLLPLPGVRRFLYRWLSLEGIQPLLTGKGLGGSEPEARGVRHSLLVARAVLAGMTLVTLVAVTGAARQLARPAVVQPAQAGGTLPAVAEALPPLPAGVTPGAIWLVERGNGFEQLSNGLRIETAWSVQGDPRLYHVFDAEAGLVNEVHDRPAGLLFHTTESDIWPLEAGYNEKLRDSSERLLKYLQRNRTYHYLIDRFGRVFRVVEEASKANHAGHSVWESGGTVYLNLNHAFLGVSFESRWGGGQTLPITQAQLVAGRNLTDYLRQRFEIPAGMCVAHGLTSVNPKQHRIGHHMDWSRGFPWAAFGLPDQYAREAPSVALFGFGYDQDFLKVLPEPWDGVRAAEERLAEAARREGRSLEDVRRERQRTYDRWTAEQAQADRKGGEKVDRASVVRPQGAASGG
ncbi:MAG TPA: peptidoglycan recognition family protein [Vicinamibacteria bacterium]|nr:peptidoglycan recognition family protein [Vicinamibacteria bacterium]